MGVVGSTGGRDGKGIVWYRRYRWYGHSMGGVGDIGNMRWCRCCR